MPGTRFDEARSVNTSLSLLGTKENALKHAILGCKCVIKYVVFLVHDYQLMLTIHKPTL